MLIRILTSIVCLPLLFFLVISGGFPLRIAVLICAILGMSEIYNALSRKNSGIHFLGYVFACSYILFINKLNLHSALILFSAFIVITLICMVVRYKKINIIDSMVTFFGFFYVAFLLSLVCIVREQNYGDFFVWLIFICAWGTDTFAYFCGKMFGRHKLIPDLSPKKTIEGSIGGIVGTALIAWIYGMIASNYISINNLNIVLVYVIIGIVGSIFAQLGDLVASSIKRYAQLKDYGNIMPGHGGFMDRFDSVMFTAPVVYLAMYIIFTA